MYRLTCTDPTTRYAYGRLLNAQIATEVAAQRDSLDYMAHALNGARIVAADAAQLCRMSPRMRTALRPTINATTF